MLELLEPSADNEKERNNDDNNDDSGLFSGSSVDREVVETKKKPLRQKQSIVISFDDDYEDEAANHIEPRRLFQTARVTRSSAKKQKK